MGLFSGSSKSTSTTTTTNQDQRVAAADSGIAVGAGATLVQETLSDDVAKAAIAGAGDVVQVGADLVRDVQGQSLNFATDTVRSAQSVTEASLEASRDTVRTNAELAGTLAEVAISNLEKNKRDPSDDTLQEVAGLVGKYGAIVVAVAVAGLVAFVVLRKK